MLGHEPLDRPALAGRVPTLEHDARRWPELPLADQTAEGQAKLRESLPGAVQRAGFLLARKRRGQVELVEAAHGRDPPTSVGPGQRPGGLGLVAERVQGQRQRRRGEEDEDDPHRDQPPRAAEVARRWRSGSRPSSGRRRDRRTAAGSLRGASRHYHRRVPEAPQPGSVADVKEALGRVGYLADEPAALVAYLAQRLGKPILVEGPAGVGKTELAKAISRATGRHLIRLQCYEGLDEAKALYEWNYRKQLLRIQADDPSESRPAAPTPPADREAPPEPSGSAEAEALGRDLLRGVPARQAAARRRSPRPSRWCC